MATTSTSIHQAREDQLDVRFSVSSLDTDYVRIRSGESAHVVLFLADHAQTQRLVTLFCEAALKAGFTLPVPKDDTGEDYAAGEVLA